MAFKNSSFSVNGKSLVQFILVRVLLTLTTFQYFIIFRTLIIYILLSAWLL